MPASRRRTGSPLGRVADTVAAHPWSTGIVLGSVLGAAATVATRRLDRTARRGLVDWPRVEALASARLERAPGSLEPRELAAVEPAYAEAMREIEPRLSAFLGTPLPGVVDRIAVVDRPGWVTANLGAFESLVSRLEGGLLDDLARPHPGLLKSALTVANRELSTRQIAYLLAFMGTRVLGQYDIALLTAEAAPGRLLFVEENVRETARSLGVPLDAFRRYVALHETTHAFEFEAHPWLRPYLAERLERQLGGMTSDAAALGRDGLARLRRRLRSEARSVPGEAPADAAEHWMEWLMSPEQRRLFRETQAVMSLLEGFSDFVMDEVGREVVPGIDEIARRFHERRTRRTGIERAIMRVTGLDLKMEQYARGERFVAAVAAHGGREALARLWEGPETLPRHDEISEPARWIARVLDDGPADQGRGEG